MKLLTLLRTLQPEEHIEFQHFVKSNFFKLGERYAKFFRLLCKLHPTFDASKADMEAIYKRCFGKVAYTDSKLFNLLSGICRQVEDFLVVKMLLSEEGTSEKGRIWKELLVKALGNRNAGAYFRVEAQRLIDDTNSRPVKGLEDYLSLQQLHHQVYFDPDTAKYSEHPPRLLMAMEQLDLYYCIAKLQYVAEMKARERLFQIQYELPLLEAVMERTADPDLTDSHPLVAIYCKLVKLYFNGVTEDGFWDLKAMFDNKFTLLPKSDQQALLMHLINMGISLGVRAVDVNAEMLSLFKMAIEADVLLHGGRISHITFANIVACAALCNEFDWADSFMKRFSTYLEEGTQQATIALSSAFLYYGQGFLDKAQTSLVQSVFTTPAFEVVARGLLLKIAFDRYLKEGKDYEFLTSHLTAFEKFVKAKPLTEEKKNAQLNCIRFVRKMTAVKFEKPVVPEIEKAKLRSKLKGLQPIVSKKWLVEKIETL